MKLKIESYSAEVDRRGFPAGNYVSETVTRYRIKLGDLVLAENIPYVELAERYILAWGNKAPTKKLINLNLKEFKKQQAKSIKEFKASLVMWAKARNERTKLIKAGKEIPERLRDLNKLLKWDVK